MTGQGPMTAQESGMAASIDAASFDLGGDRIMPDPVIASTGAVAAAHFASAERFAQERDAVFRKVWLYAGRADDIPAPGDFTVRDIEMLGLSLLVLRGRDGMVRAFHNACRHRGMKLAPAGCGHAAGLRCPYHSWVYDLDGSLRGVPDEASFPDIDRAALGLVPVACGEVAGFLFVHPDPVPAIALADWLGAAAARLEHTPLAHFPHRVRLSAIVEANWKAGLDPQGEGYHVPTVHEKSIRDIVTTPAQRYRKQTTAFAGPHAMLWSPRNAGWTPPADKPVFGFALAQGGAMMARPGNEAGWPDAETPATLTIFPNLTVHPGNGGWFTQEFWPIAPDRHRWTGTYYFREPQSARDHFAIEQAMAFSRDSGMEDFLLIPQQQAALASGALDTVYYGENERLPRHHAACLEAIIRTARHNAADAQPTT